MCCWCWLLLTGAGGAYAVGEGCDDVCTGNGGDVSACGAWFLPDAAVGAAWLPVVDEEIERELKWCRWLACLFSEEFLLLALEKVLFVTELELLDAFFWFKLWFSADASLSSSSEVGSELVVTLTELDLLATWLEVALAAISVAESGLLLRFWYLDAFLAEEDECDDWDLWFVDCNCCDGSLASLVKFS